MILRPARAGDEGELESFDLGVVFSPWLDEVREIVSGLVAWQGDREHSEFDRQVIVAESGGAIVAVAAHECLESAAGRPLIDHRYLMVVAVRTDQQRSGVGNVLAESVPSRMRSDGAQTVRWLVHPHNTASIAFSRSMFPEADESYPPEDRPYVQFVLAL